MIYLSVPLMVLAFAVLVNGWPEITFGGNHTVNNHFYPNNHGEYEELEEEETDESIYN